jgi:hypothetical protein
MLTPSDIDHRARQADAALSALEASRAKLYRTDGAKLYADDEHAQREIAAESAFTDALGPALELADQAAREADEQLERLRQPIDPVAALATEDLTRAAALEPFLRADLDLPPYHLAQRIRTAIGDNDRARMAVYARVLIQTDAPADPALRDLRDQLVQAFADPKASEKRSEAERQLDLSRELRRRVRETEAKGLQLVQKERQRLVASGSYVL